MGVPAVRVAKGVCGGVLVVYSADYVSGGGMVLVVSGVLVLGGAWAMFPGCCGSDGHFVGICGSTCRAY